MRIIITAIALGLGVLMTHSAQAHVRDCTQKEYASADNSVGWNADEVHQQFTVPEITYSRPLVKGAGIQLVFVVGQSGGIECIDNRGGWVKKALAETPQRKALLGSIESWHFKPFIVDGKPVRTVTNVFVTEKIDFHYHEDMPAGRLYSTVIRLMRSSCFGTCPDYSVTVHGDGRVEYQGNAFVDVRGKHNYTISPGAVAALVERLRAHDVWSMAGNWIAPVTDSATYRTTITIDGKTHIIVDYVGREIGMPEAISEAENDIDETAQTESMIHLDKRGLDRLQDERFAFRSQAGADLLARSVYNSYTTDNVALGDLIDRGAPVRDGRADCGWRCGDNSHNPDLLLGAIYNRREDLASRLMDMGALKTAGKLDQAKIDKAFQAAISAGRLAPVMRLWEYHPSLNFVYKDEYKETEKRIPVSLLIEKPNNMEDWQGFEIAKFLLDKGCDINASGPDGTTLLRYAASGESPEFIQYLIDHGANIEAVEDGGETPIIFSDMSEDGLMVFLKAGANVMVKTDIGSVFEIVATHKYARAREWLVAHGHGAEMELAEKAAAEHSN